MKEVLTGLAMLMAALPAYAIDGLRFGSIDSTLGIDAVAAELDGVVESVSPKFSRVVSGKDAEGRSVLLAGNTDTIEMISATWKGSVSSNDLRTLGDIEDEFDLTGVERVIHEKCSPSVHADPSLMCTQVEYGCEDDYCPVTFLSFYVDDRKDAGTTRMGWALSREANSRFDTRD